MPKKLPTTPRGRVKNVLRQLWLRSRERAAALKRTGYCCSDCGVKQSTAKGREVKIQVHHTHGIGNWERVIDMVYEEILCAPEMMEPLCKKCHEGKHLKLSQTIRN